MTKAHIANHFLQASIGGAVRQGHTAVALFHDANIPIEWLNCPDQRISEQQFTRLIKAVWRTTQDEFMGLAPQACRNGIFALMAEFCLSAATLGAMLKRSARFYSTVYEDIDIGLEEHPENEESLVLFRLDLQDSHNDPDHLLQEFLLLMWQRFSCWLVDQQIPIAATQFRYKAPKHAEEYRAMYPGKHLFSQPFGGFYLHPRYLQLPIVRSEAELAIFLEESPAYILHRPDQDHSLQAKIRFIVAQHDFSSMPDLESLGKELNLTPRTITRKLKDEGTCFSKIKESLRRDCAIKLLKNEHLDISDVGERVGFTETASFSRAFKRWTGKTPSAWKHKHLVAKAD